MPDNRFVYPAIAAIALAILFPSYWFTQFWSVNDNGLHQDLSGLNASDATFLIIGVLSMFVYWGLKKYLNQRHEFHDADLPLLFLIILSGTFTLGLLSMDVFMHLFGKSLHLPWHTNVIYLNTAVLLISTAIFGVLNIVLGVVLFTKARDFSSVLKAFAVVTLVEGVFEVSVILSPISIIIFPVALILLAVLFIRQPETLEVI